MALPEEIRSLFHKSLDLEQISDEAIGIISKAFYEEFLTDKELDALLNPTEAAALLTAKYKRAVSHRYIKEITRSVRNPITGHVTPARLNHDRVAGKTHLYRTRNVLGVKLRQKSNISVINSDIPQISGNQISEAA